jgi:hypothetical protein
MPVLRQRGDAQVTQWRAEVSVQNVRSQNHTEYKINSARPASVHCDWSLSQHHEYYRSAGSRPLMLTRCRCEPATSEVTELDELYTFVRKQTLPDYRKTGWAGQACTALRNL